MRFRCLNLRKYLLETMDLALDVGHILIEIET